MGSDDSIKRLNEILGEIFLEQYPLFQRRLSWFQLEKKDMMGKQLYFMMKLHYEEAKMSEMGDD